MVEEGGGRGGGGGRCEVVSGDAVNGGGMGVEYMSWVLCGKV